MKVMLTHYKEKV